MSAVLHIGAGALLALAASSSFAGALAFSNFSSGRDGWEAKNGAQEFTWFPTGGDPLGYIQAKDASGEGLWFFSAPDKFLGNKAAAYGGSLSFDLKRVSLSPPMVGVFADVQMIAASGDQISFVGNIQPTLSWSSYTVQLIPNGSWTFASASGPAATETQMRSVLSDLISIRIRGDFTQKGEATGLDTVLLAAGPVPEPATSALWLGGALALAATVRRRQRAGQLR